MEKLEGQLDWFRKTILPLDPLSRSLSKDGTSKEKEKEKDSSNKNEDQGFVNITPEALRQLEKSTELGALNTFLQRQSDFHNIFNMERMEDTLKIRNDGSYLDALFMNRYDVKDNYLKLREDQNMNWAIDTVKTGIPIAKEGKFEEAIKIYNHALEIYPQCVEAYVARGAAYANAGNLTKAISNFEEALQINPNDVNAKKYLEITKEKDATLQSREHSAALSGLSEKALSKLQEEREKWKKEEKKKKKGKNEKKEKKEKKDKKEKRDKKVSIPFVAISFQDSHNHVFFSSLLPSIIL